MDSELVPFNSDYVVQAAQLARKVGWPHREEDWLAALQLGEGVAVVAESQLIGTALYWRWGQQYASLGLVIVDPSHQGQGIGHQLVSNAVTALADSTVRLSATAAGEGLYKKHGFIASNHMQQWQSPALCAIDSLRPHSGTHIRQAISPDLAELTQLDAAAHGQYRPHLLRSLLGEESRVLVIEQQGSIQAYAGLRRFGHGLMIGPVVSHTQQQAKQLISHLLAAQEGAFVRIDIIEDSGLGEWLHALGLQLRDRTVIMTRGSPWCTSGIKNIAVMSQAMG